MKRRNRVIFTYLDMFYFRRCLGSDKVPESGNSPLGMEASHFSKERLNIFDIGDTSIGVNGDCLTKITRHERRHSSDRDSLQSVLSIDYTEHSLQPLNARQRLKCLRESGVEVVKDDQWANEGRCLVKLRQTRQQVGCKCAGTNHCDQSKCLCSSEGIPCQSDGSRFPCRCGSKCLNESGKRVYSQLKVKYHYKHTLERDLSAEQPLLISEKGDCQQCSDINDDALKRLLGAPGNTRRKRVSNVHHKIDYKLYKSKNSESKEDTKVRCGKNPTVMTLTSIMYPSLTYENLFTIAKSPLVGFDFGKENIGEEENKDEWSCSPVYMSPGKARSALMPIQVPVYSPVISPILGNDSWASMELSDHSRNILSITQENNNATDRWQTFFNRKFPKLDTPSPICAHKTDLNLISLATDMPEIFTPLVDYSLDSISSPPPPSSPDLPRPVNETTNDSAKELPPYKFRRSTTIDAHNYCESPFMKYARRRKRRQTMLRTLKEHYDKSMLNIEKSEEESLGILVSNLEAIALTDEKTEVDNCEPHLNEDEPLNREL